MIDRACEQLQMEVVVGGRGQVGQAQVAVRPFLQNTEIEPDRVERAGPGSGRP